MAIVFRNHTVRFSGKDATLLLQLTQKSGLTSAQVLEEALRALAQRLKLKVPKKGKPWFREINPKT